MIVEKLVAAVDAFGAFEEFDVVEAFDFDDIFEAVEAF